MLGNTIQLLPWKIQINHCHFWKTLVRVFFGPINRPQTPPMMTSQLQSRWLSFLQPLIILKNIVCQNYLRYSLQIYKGLVLSSIIDEHWKRFPENIHRLIHVLWCCHNNSNKLPYCLVGWDQFNTNIMSKIWYPLGLVSATIIDG